MMKRNKIFHMGKKTLYGLLITSSMLFSATYEINKDNSKVGFDIDHFGVSNVHGDFEKFDAQIQYDEISNRLTFFESSVSVDSVNTKNKERDDYIKQTDYFDVENHPNMKFEFVRIDSNKDIMFAYLTIKDTRKLISFDYKLNDSIDTNLLEFDLTTTIKRSDFNIGKSSFFSLGNMVLSDDVNINVQLQAKRSN